MGDTGTDTQKAGTPPGRKFSRKTIGMLIVGLLLATLAGLLIADYTSTVRIKNLSATTALDARGGKIVIEYTRPVPRPLYHRGKEGLHTRVQLSRDGLKETHELVYPTKYNHDYALIRREDTTLHKLFGLFLPPTHIALGTGMEQVAIKGMLPPAGSLPAPEAMDNQLVLQFQGEVIGKYKTGINIPIEEMNFVRLTPEVRGYYRWSNDSTLTFNFTEDRPQYETTYRFEVFPENIINTDHQVWKGANTTIEVTTSNNEVYVVDNGFKGKVRWNQPLHVEFSGNMVGALDVLKKKAPDIVAARITPATPGVWIWSNARTLEFHPDPDEGWPARKQLTLTLLPELNTDPDRTWRGGKPIVYPFEILPREQSILNYNLHGEQVALEEELSLRFSRPMVEQERLHQKFSNQGVKAHMPVLFDPPIEGQFYWTRQDKLKFRPANLWSELTEYTIRLNPAFNPDPRYEWTGTRSFKFKTVENLVRAAAYFTPEERLSPSLFFSDKGRYGRDTEIKPEARLWLEFDKDIGRFVQQDLALGEAVKITPAIEGEFAWLSHGLLEFRPKDNWRENTGYRIELTKKLLHHPQQHFEKGQNVFAFRTGKNLVRSARLNKSATQKNTPLVQAPTQGLQIDFSKNMNTGLAIGREYTLGELAPSDAPVSLEPALDARVSWQDARTLLIEPLTYWQPETLYTLTLNEALLPQAEARFENGRQFFVKTRKNYVRLTRFTPTGQVGRRIVIDARFDRDIKPADIKPGTREDTGLFSIEPALKGQWRWLAADKLQFTPTEPLAESTAYTVRFDPNRIADKQFSWTVPPEEGNSAYPLAAFRFQTPALHVARGDARFEFDKKNILKQRFYLDIALSGAVDEKQLRKHFSIWYEKSDEDGKRIEVPLLYHLKVGGKDAQGAVKDFSVVSDWIERPAEDRRIRYRITAGLDPLTGNLPLARDYNSDFLQERPKHIGLNGVNWQWRDNRHSARLSFSAPIAPEELSAALSINHLETEGEPRVAFELNVASGAGQRTFDYEVTADFLPGHNYAFRVAQGLLAADGAFTPDALYLTSGVPNLAQELAFALDGSVLSRRDLAMVAVRSTNIDEFFLTIDQIYANNVDYFLNNRIDSYRINDVAKTVFHQKYAVAQVTGYANTHNKAITTHVNLREVMRKNPHGLFRVTVNRPNQNQRGSANSRWFLATDIGLSARRFNEELVVWTHSLNSAEALADVRIEAIDQWNQVIGSAYSSHAGLAQIHLPEGAVPTHLVARRGEDFSFLDFKKHRDRLAGADVEGVGAKQSVLRSYIYSERGVYRPGDTVHLVAVTRGREGTLPERFPVVFKLNDPSGKETLNEPFTLDESGLYVYDFEIPAEAKTGKWQSSLSWKNRTIGTYQFQVEEFIPNKIKVELEHIGARVHGGDTLKFKVKARNLFGPPAAGRRVNASVNLRANNFKPAGHAAFTFGHDDTHFQRIDEALLETRLDENGEYIYEYPIPEGIDSPNGLSAHYSATVIDDGGRGVAAYASTDVLMYAQYLGLRSLSTRQASLDTPIGLEAVNVDALGKPIPRNQQQLVFRVYRDKQVTHYRKNERGYYRYVTERERILVDELEDPRDEQGKFSYQPRYAGEHILEAEDKLGGQITRLRFYVRGAESSDQIIEQADKVELKLAPGPVDIDQEIEIEVRTPFPGKVLLIGEREKVLFTRVLDMTQQTQRVRLHVEPRYLPNFYISAMALRPVSEGDRKNPIYATGLINVQVRDPAHTPSIKLSVPKRATPNGELRVTLDVGDTHGADMHYTIAAVDEGILALTQYSLPNMRDHFNQKRRLEVEHYAMYPMVMPFESDIKHVITPSGDAPSRALIKKKRVNPDSQQRVKSVALWSGLLKTDARGHAEVSFKIPDFDGTLRVMAVAYGDQRFASAQKHVVVRDRLVMKPTLPRFLATGDDFAIPVNLFNATGLDGEVKLRIETSDHLKVLGPSERRVYVPEDGEASLAFAAAVNFERGLAQVELIAEGMGETTRKIIKLPVRAPGTLATFGDGGVIDRRTPRSLVMPGGFVDGTQTLAMKITSNRLARFENSLRYLLRYPHGCLEQTTSKVFPLIYYSQMSSSAGELFTDERTPRYYLREGIAKIERMQLENGAFAYWEGRNQVNNWSFVYAAHFMVEAKRAGLKINNSTWNNMIFQLDQIVAQDLQARSLYDRHRGVSHRLYALYVLALANQNVLGHLNHIRDSYFDELKPHDKARLAMGFAALGDKETAVSILGGITGLSAYDDPYRDTGGAFASNVRDLAIVLDALTSISPDSDQIPVLIDKLADLSRGGRWGTTQDNAFAYLAIGKAAASAEAMQVKANITLGDGSTVPFDKDVLLQTAELLKGEVRIEMQGEGQLSYAWEAVGIEKDPASLQEDQGLRVRRRFLDKNREPVDLKNVKQGDLLVAEITLESLSAPLENVVVTDLLPSGLEIENARLSTSASLPWIKSDLQADYVDIRDDRINVFLTAPTRKGRYYYTVRAVTVGNFKLPAIHAEAMYDPAKFSKSDDGQVKILPAGGRSNFSVEID